MAIAQNDLIKAILSSCSWFHFCSSLSMMNKMKLSQNAINVFLILFFSLNAWTGTIPFGAEFEFWNPQIKRNTQPFSEQDIDQTVERAEQLKFVQSMQQQCLVLKCEVLEVTGKWGVDDYRVQYKDGWWFKISIDPGCVEITFKPSTDDELKARTKLINDHIFGTARNLDMTVNEKHMHHFNFSVRHMFQDSGKEFLKFFVDYSNHPELALGGLGKDYLNAPPLALLGDEQRKGLQSVIERFNKNEIQTIGHIAYEIMTSVYTKTFYEPWGGADHYQAIGLKYVSRANLRYEDAPVELRSMWAQKDIQTFLKIAELLEKRVLFLKNSNLPLVYLESSRNTFDPTEINTRFFIYVEEAGMKYQDFKSLLGPEVQKSGLTAFVKPDANPLIRLNNSEKYLDLLLISPLSNQLFIQILSDPEVLNHPARQRILNKISEQKRKYEAIEKAKTEQIKNRSILNKLSNKFTGLFQKNKDQVQTISEVQILNDILLKVEFESSRKMQMHRQQKTMSCRGLF